MENLSWQSGGGSDHSKMHPSIVSRTSKLYLGFWNDYLLQVDVKANDLVYGGLEMPGAVA
jgi:hypothetical protein